MDARTGRTPPRRPGLLWRLVARLRPDSHGHTRADGRGPRSAVQREGARDGSVFRGRWHRIDQGPRVGAVMERRSPDADCAVRVRHGARHARMGGRAVGGARRLFVICEGRRQREQAPGGNMVLAALSEAATGTDGAVRNSE